eukprot:7794504-Alexandrium_andersonii.AAC.1
MSASLVGSEMCIRDRFSLIANRHCLLYEKGFSFYVAPEAMADGDKRWAAVGSSLGSSGRWCEPAGGTAVA